MMSITIDQFDAFFEDLHHHRPYPWQRRLAQWAVAGQWPGAIDLPTASGKTACLDIALFALASQAFDPPEQRTAPRRVFFCVNRRVIVDEAYERARRIARMIREAERDGGADKPVLKEMAKALRTIGGTLPEDGVPPVDVLELRGGIYRDNRWARSITQPSIVCTTIDQLGSRLLFRGYGVSPAAAPIQAALIAYDSLILLDEAHISEPFRQTLQSVRGYLDPDRWAEQPLNIRPAWVVPMTATPPADVNPHDVVKLEADDRANERLSCRLAAPKLCELSPLVPDISKAVSRRAKTLAKGPPVAVGIMVNRVATARQIYRQLVADHQDAAVELVIGSMRPIDRDRQARRLSELIGPDRPQITEKMSFTVATQCLEVGADYDFDVLITECASLDALRQRFGRLNRAGRPIDARGVILANKRDIKPDDELNDENTGHPIYGNALARTWNWLQQHAVDGAVDFGIDAFQQLLGPHGADGQPPKELLAPSASANAPVMLPAHIDLWCQTAPRPTPDPDIALFIHGPQVSQPDVQICWRADLVEVEATGTWKWPDFVSLLPPTAAESMRVPISRVRRWLANPRAAEGDGDGDVLGTADEEAVNTDDLPSQPRGVLWRGDGETRTLASPDQLMPGDTLVLPATAPGSHLIGHLPEAGNQVDDIAEIAFARARDRAALRLHPHLQSRLPDSKAFAILLERAADPEDLPTDAEWRDLLAAAAETLGADHTDLKTTLGYLASDGGLRVDLYPDRRGVVLTTRRRIGVSTDWFQPLDEGADESSRIQRAEPVRLDHHTQHVRQAVQQANQQLPLAELPPIFDRAAELHDLGKADERFQAMLRRTDRTDAWLFHGASPAPLAKSDGVALTRSDRIAARQRAGLPEGFRHEMLSVQLAERAGALPPDSGLRQLVLHLIAAHHGHARPFAPVVHDEELPAVQTNGLALSHQDRAALIPPHRLDSGIPERFWQLTRRFGWWGLAYLEAVLCLADQQASAAEDDQHDEDQPANESAEAAP